MEITPDLVGNSLVVMVIVYFVAFAFQIYVLYLNWKQAKVNNQMEELVSEVKEIRKLLETKKVVKKKN